MNDLTVRQRLLASSAELFARKGYASTTVREIVEAAKVTKPALYYYFQNKRKFILELMREAESRFEILLGSARKRNRDSQKKGPAFFRASFSAIFGPD